MNFNKCVSICTVNILVGNVRDYNFYRKNVNLIKGVSRIWNVPIHLTESVNNSNSNRTMMTKDNNSDSICVQYTHTSDCSLLITAMVNEKTWCLIIF